MALTQANEQVPLQPQVVAYVILSGQSATIGSTVILANAPPGIYRMSQCIVMTNAGTSGTLTVNGVSTDDSTSHSTAGATVTVASTANGSGSVILENAAIANIQYSVTIGVGTLSPGIFSLYLVLERLF